MINIDQGPNCDFICVKYNGTITKQDLLLHMRRITDITYGQKNVKILEDAREGNVTSDFTDIDMIIDYFKSYSRNRDLFAVATLTNSPTETALYTLLQESLDWPNYHFKVFAEKENAISWLNSL